jgi:D-proline reductase (dithiol) PrdB
MAIDSFKWMPASLAAMYQNMPAEREEPVPWTPLAKPLNRCRFALVTTAGIYVPGREPPFDTEREEREPTWGDPSYRTIPRDTRQEEIGACHLHINNRDILADFNIVLPLDRFREMEEGGEIGSLAPTHYSFMGFQLNTAEWRERYAPEVAARLRQEEVDAVLLTPV